MTRPNSSETGMPYYAGDWGQRTIMGLHPGSRIPRMPFRGDYYAGDFWGSLGGIVKKIAPIATSFIPGGGLISKAIGLLGAGTAAYEVGSEIGSHFSPSMSLATGGGGPRLPMTSLEAPAGRSIMHPFAGGTSFKGQYAGHPNKSTYVTRGGGTSKWPNTLVLHPRGTVAVKRRRMHVGNTKAAVRALRRLHGFAKMARKVYTVTHPKKGATHRFRRRRK